MRAAAIFGPGSSEKQLTTFRQGSDITWQTGLNLPSDAVVVFGGDGTLHRWLPQLVEARLPVLVVPCGSGNDFARALEINNSRRALAAWRKFAAGGSNVREIDLGVIRSAEGQHYFSTVAGVGIDGKVARRANQLPRWMRGNGGYALTLLPVIFRFAALPIRVSPSGLPEGEFKPTVLAACANVPAYGGGMRIAPRALLDDGKLDICVISDINRFKLFCLFPTIYFGRHLGMDEVNCFQAERVRLETEQPLDVYADGEFVCKTPVEVGVERAALRVIVP